MHHLADAPIWPDIYDAVSQTFKSRPLIIYNANYDTRILNATSRAFNLPTFTFNDCHCAMQLFAMFYGDQFKNGRFKFKKLSFAAQHLNLPPRQYHAALDDALTIVDIFQAISRLPVDEIKY